MSIYLMKNLNLYRKTNATKKENLQKQQRVLELKGTDFTSMQYINRNLASRHFAFRGISSNNQQHIKLSKDIEQEDEVNLRGSIETTSDDINIICKKSVILTNKETAILPKLNNITAEENVILKNVDVQTVNAQQIKLSGQTRVGIIIIKEGSKPRVMLKDNPKVTEQIKFPEGTAGEVILLRNENGDYPQESINADQIINGTIYVDTNVRGDEINLSGDKKVNKITGNNVNMTGSTSAEEIVARSQVKLSGEAVADRITASSVELDNKAMVKDTIRITTLDNPKLIIKDSAKVTGQVKFPEGTTGEVLIKPFSIAACTPLSEEQVENGVVNVNGDGAQNINLWGKSRVTEIKTKGNVSINGEIKAKKIEGKDVSITKSANAEEIKAADTVLMQKESKAVQIEAIRVNLYEKAEAGTIKAKKSMSLHDNTKVKSIIMTGSEKPVARIFGKDVKVNNIEFQQGSDGQVILLPDDKGNKLSEEDINDKVKNGVILTEEPVGNYFF